MKDFKDRKIIKKRLSIYLILVIKDKIKQVIIGFIMAKENIAN